MIPEWAKPLDEKPGLPSWATDLDRGLSPEQIQAESGGRDFDRKGNLLTSPKGAMGRAQVMPATATDPGFGVRPADPKIMASGDKNAIASELFRVGNEYMAAMRDRYGDEQLALAAYNAGPGAVDKAGGVPNIPETQAYVKNADRQQPPRPRTIPQPVTIDPTEGMNPLQLGLAGMGKAFYDIGSGVGQMGRQVLPETWANAIGMPTQEEIDANKKLDEPLMRTKSGILGNIAGNIAMIAPAAMIPGVNTYTGAAATGGLLNALQPMETGQSRGAEAAKGAVFGVLSQGLGNVVGRALKPIQTNMPAEEAALVAKAQQMGLPLNAAQITGSKPLAWIDSALDNLPFTAGKQAAAKGAQRDAWQRAVLQEVGENADVASPEVMGAAYQRIGNQFNGLSARNMVNMGDDFIEAVVKIDQSITPFSKGVRSVVDRALELASKGTISGREYQSVRESLGKASKGAWKNNPELGQALKSLRNALDDAAGQSIRPQDKAAWELARSQYRNLKTIEKAVDPATGAISPKKMINELARSNPMGVKYGQGNQTMPDLARVGKQFIADTLPDSGTAQRAWYMNMLQSPTAGVGGLLGFVGGGAPGALLGAAAGAGTPLAAQRALWRNGRYLTKGLLDPVTTNAFARTLGIPTIPQVPALLE